MDWIISYYNQVVENSILKLPDGILARYLRLTDIMLEFGPNLGMPHTRSLKNGLFELRIKSKEGIARAFFCTRVGKKIIILHVFIKKTNKTPGKEMKIALSRLEEVKKDES